MRFLSFLKCEILPFEQVAYTKYVHPHMRLLVAYKSCVRAILQRMVWNAFGTFTRSLPRQWHWSHEHPNTCLVLATARLGCGVRLRQPLGKTEKWTWAVSGRFNQKQSAGCCHIAVCISRECCFLVFGHRLLNEQKMTENRPVLN